MSQIIQNLSAAGFDIHSYLTAARQANEKYSSITKANAVKVMQSLFGLRVDTDHDRAASLALRYMIAESIRKHVQGFNVTEDDVRIFGSEKTREFFQRNPWADPTFRGEIQDTPTAVEILEDVPVEEIKLERKKVGGKIVKPKKGLKQEAAKKIYEANRGKPNAEIIALFMSQLDMSKPGATTYLYNVRKEFGDIPEGAKKGRKPKQH